MESAAADIDFEQLNTIQLLQWAKDNPQHAGDWDCGGRTALYAAAKKGDQTSLIWLIEKHGAHVNGRTRWGDNTALHFAADAPTIRALLARGADPDLRDGGGWTALMRFVHNGSVERVYAVLEHPRACEWVNVFSPGEGMTALHLACSRHFTRDFGQNMQTAMVRYLLAANASPAIQDDWGHTPTDLLISHRVVNHDALELLREAEAQEAEYLVRIPLSNARRRRGGGGGGGGGGGR